MKLFLLITLLVILLFTSSGKKSIFNYVKLGNKNNHSNHNNHNNLDVISNKNLRLDKLNVVSSHGRDDNTNSTAEVSMFQVIIRAIYLIILFQPVLWTLPLAYFIPSFMKTVWFPLLYRTIAHSGAAFIKWGQWAATRPDMFPEQLCHALSNLHANAKQHSYSITARMIEHELGAPINQIFSSFEQEPIASGSIAQVYKAILNTNFNNPTGTHDDDNDNDNRKSNKNKRNNEDKQNINPTVAVKVRHPGVMEQITIDFKLMRVVAEFVENFPFAKNLGLKESMLQFSHTISAQTDLVIEGVHLAIFNRNFKRMKNDLDFPVPLILTQSVLVESFEEGRSVAEYTRLYNSKNGKNINEGIINSPLALGIVRVGMDIYLKMLLEDNLMHADFHPGNILIQDSVFKKKSNMKKMYNDKNSKLEIENDISGSDTIVRKTDSGGEIKLQNTDTLMGMVSSTESHPRVILVDAGMVAKLTRQEQTNYIGMLQAMGEGNGRKAARHVLSFTDKPSYTLEQRKDFEDAMGEMFHVKCRGYGTGVDLGSVLRSVLKLVRIHQIRIDANYATLVMNALCLDGLATQLIPGYVVLDSSKWLLKMHALCKRTPFRLGLGLFYLGLPFFRFLKHMDDRNFRHHLVNEGINLHKQNAIQNLLFTDDED